MNRVFLAAATLLALVAPLIAQPFAPPASKPPDEATAKAIAQKTEKLGKALTALRKLGVRDPSLGDTEIYHKAAVWIARHNEFYHDNAATWTSEVLDRGLLRASQLGQGEAPWLHQAGETVVRSFRSRVDGSLQPFAVTLPADYGKDMQKKWRIDVVLHGRDPGLSEVKFLHQYVQRPVPKDQAYIRLDFFGRGNNAYRWAGETDVFEAMEAFYAVERWLGRGQLIDLDRVVLRGFSMGGAGTWHIGLHYPDQWCVLGPGAGFTTTRGYLKSLPEKLPPYQNACLHIYDAVDYAENAFNVPIVAYAGEKDPQAEASANMEVRLRKLGIPMTRLIAPGLGHSFPPEWQQKAEAEYAKHADPAKGRRETPTKVRFVTYTLRYPSCSWVEMLALDNHYQRSLIEAERTDTGFNVKTANVRALRLGLPDYALSEKNLSIDGQELRVKPYVSMLGSVNIYLERRDGNWGPVLPQRLVVDRVRNLRKVTGLQGPIDDAFMTAFLCVKGTGKPWHPATQKFADASLQRFQKEWAKYFRGDLPVKDDVDVTEEDISTRHLILFGDPASNSLIAQALPGLPLKWTKESVVLGGTTSSAAEHIPVLIYPSPLNTGRYVVLNTGHTFHAEDLQGTNALLYPRLGDYAILKIAPTDKDPLAATVQSAGLFDDNWRIK